MSLVGVVHIGPKLVPGLYPSQAEGHSLLSFHVCAWVLLLFTVQKHACFGQLETPADPC